MCYHLYFYVLEVDRMESRYSQSPRSLSWTNTALEELIKSTLTLVFHGSCLSVQLFKKNTSTCFEQFWIVLYLLVLVSQLVCKLFQGKTCLLFLVCLRPSHCHVGIQKMFVTIKADNLLITRTTCKNYPLCPSPHKKTNPKSPVNDHLDFVDEKGTA